MRTTLIRTAGAVVAMAGLVAATSTTAAASVTADSTPPTAAGQALAAVPLSSLPAGAAPQGYAYGIGKRLFLNGRMYDLAPNWSKIASKPSNNAPGLSQEFKDVDQTRGVLLWAFETLGIDQYLEVGNLVPGHAPKRLSSDSAQAPIATTSGGIYGVGAQSISGGPGSSNSYTSSGVSTPPALMDDDGEHASPGRPALVSSVTSGLVVNLEHSVGPANPQAVTHKSWRYYPTHGQSALPYDNTYGAGNGQLVTRDTNTGPCWRTAALASPATLRARVCSQVFPKVSTDGTRVAVVQDRHIKLYNTATGALVSTTNAPTLTSWDSQHFYTLLGWEDANNYLVKARNGTDLYILRCTTNGACQRAVTSTVRTGVSSIVT